jgi:hypothetical protein
VLLLSNGFTRACPSYPEGQPRPASTTPRDDFGAFQPPRRAIETVSPPPRKVTGRCSCHSEKRPERAPASPKGHRNVLLLPRRVARAKKTNQQLSWSLSPLRRVSPGESTRPRLATPGTFRPQGFSPSRRLTPHLNVRPCFVPVTPMGFPLSRGFPPLSGPRVRHPGNTLLTFSP